MYVDTMIVRLNKTKWKLEYFKLVLKCVIPQNFFCLTAAILIPQGAGLQKLHKKLTF